MAQYKTYSTLVKEDKALDPESLPEVPSITSAKHRKTIIQNTFLVVVDNFARWCNPCIACSPQVSVLSGKYSRSGMCAIVKEDVDDKHGEYPVKILGVPCFHFYVNGQFLKDETITGADVGAVEQTIRRILNAK